ncbi:DUF2860 domain-containing protein [uncultured Photobacterium sp.]|uniref:DUF2860 domain-containing protein n=1 Tax=uncultured Photobacterium sp. TaxID=173973 RepID=UPI00260343D2|nr:DUF2860 domain-containing protein [uncultured Photobacterium sp.]
MKPLKLCLFTGIVSTSVVAASGPKWTPGFGADISFLGGYTKETSQFNTDNKVTDSLDNNGQSQSEAIFAPLGTISYTTVQADKQVYFGTSRSDVALGRFHVELGYRQQLPENGMVSISYVPGIVDTSTWEDPFVTGEPRKKTDSKIKGVRLQYDRVLGSNFSIEVAGGKQEIENEKSGQHSFTSQEQSLLEREGNILFSQLSYFQSLNQRLLLRGAVSYSRIDTDGNALANDIYGAEIGVIQFLPSSSLALTFSYDYADFDKANPVFDKKQQDDRWGVFLAYEYQEPFGWENWGLVSLAGYNQSNSNINFYDEDSLLISAGINYRF